MAELLVGRTEPRIFTPPLRELTPETSMGFQVVEFAKVILGVDLYPWQQWLLVHALELNEDGSYRFRRVITLVARQQGKTKLVTVLAAWWLFVDSRRFPKRVLPSDFKVLGTAQNLDIARDSWLGVGRWCDPDDDEAIPSLQGDTKKSSGSHGYEALIMKNKTTYEIRAANRGAGRGKSAARVIMDELREQRNWDAWSAISQTTKAVFNSQLWGISNAGDAQSVVLMHQRETAMHFIREWDELVVTGKVPMEEFGADRNGSLALFEWSAPQDCAMDDVEGILQSNPSIGYGEITWDGIRADRDGMPEREYRTEVLCQWVTAMVEGPFAPGVFEACVDPASRIAVDSPRVLAIDTSHNRGMSYLAVAGYRDDGLPHCEVIMKRANTEWVVETVSEKLAFTPDAVVVQGRGAPASSLIEFLKLADVDVTECQGNDLGASCGQFADRVMSKSVRFLDQDALNIAAGDAVKKDLGEVWVWNRAKSPVDVAPLCAVTMALWGLEMLSDGVVTVTAYGDDYEKWW